MKMKYVIFSMNGIEVPVIFTGLTAHSYMTEKLSDWKPVSAGFVSLTEDGLIAYGDSVTLGISSREEDTQIINRFFEEK